MKIKRLLLLLTLAWAIGSLNAAKLNMFVETNRFLDKNSGTILNIDYQIPYKNLVFLSQKGAFFAEIDVKVSIFQADSLIYQGSRMDNIGVRNKHDATASDKMYLNRLVFKLLEGMHRVVFEVMDINSKDQFVWEFSIPSIGLLDFVSDIELCSTVKADSTTYLERFKRGGTLYQTMPSLVFSKDDQEQIYLYYEIYQSLDKELNAVLMIEQGEEMILDQMFTFVPKANYEGRTLGIPLKDLKAGKYTGSILLYRDDQSIQRDFEFFIAENQSQYHFLFPDPDEEYNLMRYFISGKLPANWKSLDKETKRNFISNFWYSMASSSGKSVDEIKKLINERIQYANKFYTHFSPGWTTDMGRIHVKYGNPDEIEKEQTSDETRFVRKDYQIWKYRSFSSGVYVFLDMQMNGNYRLIYVANDDSEKGMPDWERYLGTDFDTSKLRN